MSPKRRHSRKPRRTVPPASVMNSASSPSPICSGTCCRCSTLATSPCRAMIGSSPRSSAWSGGCRGPAVTASITRRAHMMILRMLLRASSRCSPLLSPTTRHWIGFAGRMPMHGMLGKRRACGNTSTGMRDGAPKTDIVPLNFDVRFTPAASTGRRNTHLGRSAQRPFCAEAAKIDTDNLGG